MGVWYQAVVLPKRRAFMPTNEQFARLVEALRTSQWARSRAGSRAPQLLHRCVPGGDPRRHGLPLPVPFTKAVVEEIRKPNDPDAAADELRVELIVDRADAVDEYGDVVEDDELFQPILMVDDEHPIGYSIHVMLTRDFTQHWGNNVEAATPVCACGKELAYGVMVRSRALWPAVHDDHVHALCPACERPYDPDAQARTRVLRDTRYERAEPRPTAHEYAPLHSHVAVVVDFDEDWPVLPAGKYLEIDPALVALCDATFGEPFEVVHLFT